MSDTKKRALPALLAQLAAPFPPEAISWRVGATTRDKTRGLALPYIDARDVQDRLDDVCGINWQCRHHSCGAEKLACEIGIKFGDEWIWRGDGAGSTDFEAEKGAFSDAFKRAAVRWGVGRYLYDLASPWVRLEAKGHSHVIATSEIANLHRLLAGHAMDDPARARRQETPMPQGAAYGPDPLPQSRYDAPKIDGEAPTATESTRAMFEASLTEEALQAVHRGLQGYQEFWVALSPKERRLLLEGHEERKQLAMDADAAIATERDGA